MASSHSPLTGIFLILGRQLFTQTPVGSESQSPDGDFFDPGPWIWYVKATMSQKSQSPDGDFFDPGPFESSAI